MKNGRYLAFGVIGLAAALGAASLAWSVLSRHIADDTYAAALVADDAGDTPRAMKLFEEACREGSGRACKALDEQRLSDTRHKEK